MLQRTLLILTLIAPGFLAAPALAAGAVTAPAARPVAGPVGVITRFQDTLIAVMKKAKTLGYRGRYAKLAPVVTATHDLPVIAQIALGQYWGRLTAAQRSEFVKTFTRLSIATYAARFDAYGGEIFTKPTERKLGGGDVLIESQLRSPDGSKVQFAYQLRRIDGHWRIINIIANGVSDLALKRAEYTSVIRSHGFKALLAKLKDKIGDYSRKDANATAAS